MPAGSGLRQLERGAELRHRQFLAFQQEEQPVAGGIGEGLQPGYDCAAQRISVVNPYIRIIE